ncbi:MAG: hypothetical protein ACTHPS_10140, partial [Streptosporangiaceae bacterium]
DATFACPEVTSFCRLDELGLLVVGQRVEPDRAVLACRVAEAGEPKSRFRGAAPPRTTRRLLPAGRLYSPMAAASWKRERIPSF